MSQPYSKLYRELRAVDPTDYRRIIRMYEEREQEIGRLDVEEHFEITVHYVDALFETGAYREHQLMVDLVIRACIQHDIRYLPGRDEEMFQHQLFRKAASAFRIEEYPTTEHVLRELIGMHPEEEQYERFLRTTLFRQQQPTLQFGRAACIFSMLLTALIVTVNLLIVENFYPVHASLLRWVSLGIFLLGLSCLGGAYLWAFGRCYREARQFRRRQANKRRG